MRKNMREFCIRISIVIIVGIFLMPTGALAAKGVPKIISHQGRLLDSSSNLLGGSSGTNFCFRFSIYDASSGGTKLWPSGTPSTMTVDVTDGVYNVGVGDTAASGDTLDFNFEDNNEVYMNIEVANSDSGSCSGVSSFETLTPRHRITASGYAINADAVRGVAITSSTIPLLGLNPQINATSTNTLTLQGGSGTGDVQFFSSSNRITSTGELTLAGAITFSNLTNCDTIDTNGSGVLTCGSDAGASATTLQGAFDNDDNGSDTIIALTANDDSLIFRNPASGGTDSAFLFKLDQLATSTSQIGLDINQDSYVSGAAGLRIDVASTSPSAVPHILFGQSGTFDTNLYRNAANVLKTDDDFIIGGAATSTSLALVNDLLIIHGGTGASTAGDARTNLGLVIGTNVQAWDTQLDDIAALAVTDGNFIVGDGSNWIIENGNTARTSLGLGTGDSPTFTGLTLSGTLTANGAVTLGDGGDAISINSSDWDISTIGALSGINTIAFDSSTSTIAAFTYGGNVDASSNLLLNIGDAGTDFVSGGGLTLAGTLTANGAVTLGDGGDEISINSSDWDISNIGALTGINTIAFDSSTSTIAAFTYGGNVDASSNLLLNIGDAGTDFTTGGGLTLAGDLVVNASTTLGSTTTINGVRYIWPNADGSSNQVLHTDGSGILSWDTDDTGGGGGGAFWSDGSNFIYNSTTTDDIVLGDTTTSTAPFFFDVSASLINFGGDTNLYRSAANVLKTDDDLTVGGDFTAVSSTITGIFTLGDNGDLGSINTSDWDISNIGALSSINTISFDSATSTIGAFTAGGAIDLSSNLITNIGDAGTDFVSGGGLTLAGTLTANGAITLGDGGDEISINSSDWDISNIGALSSINTIAFDSATSTIAAFTYGGNVDASSNLLLNIGDAGTDFVSGGGLTLAGALTANNSFTLGDNGDEGSINTSDWDISNVGALSSINTIAFDSSTSTIAAFTYGGNVDASSNLLLNIGDAGTDFTSGGGLTLAGTLTANGAVTLGDGGDEISINSSDWDISNTGALTGINTIAFDSSTSTIGAFTYGGNVDASSNLLLNVGDTGTDFLSDGGLTLAGLFTVNSTSTLATTTITKLTLTNDLAITEGGTGASTAADARTNLGLVIGTNVQAWDTQLDDIAALAVTDGNFIVGDGTNWIVETGNTARTSLGLGTGDSPTFTGLTVTSALAANGGITFDASTDTIGAFTAAGTIDMNSTNLITNIGDAGTDFTSGGGLAIAGTLEVATTTSRAVFTFEGTTATASGVAAMYESITFNPSGGGTQFGNRIRIYNKPTTSANTAIGTFIRVDDNTSLANTVRGLEIQAAAGSNTTGVNTGLRAFGKTFGIQGITDALAGGTLIPAGIFAETEGDTFGNALRAYSSSITTSDLVQFFQETTAFSGEGLLMNFGKGSGSFTGNFLNLKVNDVTQFSVSSAGNVMATGTLAVAATTTLAETAGRVGIGTTSPTSLLTIIGGGVVVGTPTGGDKGAGTINASSVFDDDVLLTDYVFDKYFDGRVKPEDEERHSDYTLLTIDEMRVYIGENRHLPTIPGRDEWLKTGGFSLGMLATRLWETAETNAIYITQLNERLKDLEVIDIEELLAQASPTSKSGVIELLYDTIKSALASLGLFVSDGVVEVEELHAQTVTLNKLQLYDQATGDIYCTWIERGEWRKEPGTCDGQVPLAPQFEPEATAGEAEPTPESELEEVESEEPAETEENVIEEGITEDSIDEEVVEEVIEENSATESEPQLLPDATAGEAGSEATSEVENTVDGDDGEESVNEESAGVVEEDDEPESEPESLDSNNEEEVVEPASAETQSGVNEEEEEL